MRPTREELRKKGKELLDEIRLEYGLPEDGYYIWGESPSDLERGLYQMLAELPDEEDQRAFSDVVSQLVRRIREEGWIVLALIHSDGQVYGKGWAPEPEGKVQA